MKESNDENSGPQQIVIFTGVIQSSKTDDTNILVVALLPLLKAKSFRVSLSYSAIIPPTQLLHHGHTDLTSILMYLAPTIPSSQPYIFA